MANVTIEGRVAGIEQKGEWMEATIMCPDGQRRKMSTKNMKAWGDLRTGLYIKADCLENERPNPRGGAPFKNYYINGWGEAGDPAPYNEGAAAIAAEHAEQSRADSGPAADNPWPGKDRAIAMESAYSTAARLIAGTAHLIPDGITPAELLRVTAHMVYADIELAREGHDFTTEP